MQHKREQERKDNDKQNRKHHPTRKLEGIHEKIGDLQVYRNQNLLHLCKGLVKILMGVKSLEVDFETLTGSILEVIAEVKVDTAKAES